MKVWCGLNHAHYMSTVVKHKLKIICVRQSWSFRVRFNTASHRFLNKGNSFVSLIGLVHAIGISDFASWKRRSWSVLQLAETCHLPTLATAWSFHHLPLTNSLISCCSRSKTQWIGLGDLVSLTRVLTRKDVFWISQSCNKRSSKP